MEGQHRNDNKSPQITECQTGLGAVSALDCCTVDGSADTCRADRNVRSAAEFCLGVHAMRRNASFAPDLDKPRATADRVKVTQCFDPLGFDPLGWFAHIPIPKPHGEYDRRPRRRDRAVSSNGGAHRRVRRRERPAQPAHCPIAKTNTAEQRRPCCVFRM
jgi:hypothetical protein